MNKNIIFNTIATILVISVLYSLIAVFAEEQDIGIVEGGMYLVLSSFGALLGVGYGYHFHKWFAKNQFITSVVSTMVVMITTLEVLNLSLLPMGELCLAITFLVVSSDIAKAKNK